ncbi:MULTISPECIES: hypothetical protein [unclassified Agromyces]|uniref:hypothetical protein n=1 Tax=unclassified Agromyces TaxID=2639701 RepID=UPI0030153EEE
MRHLEQAGPELLTGLWTPLVVALITTAASVFIALQNVRSDDLKRAERLGTVLSQMPPSPERNVVATVRDDLAVSWALRQAAPVDRRLRRAATVLSTLGGVALVGAILVGLYVGLGYGRVSDWFFWVYYSVGVVLLLGAAVLRRLARRHAGAWIAAERARRGLRPPLHTGLRAEAEVQAERPTRPGSR